MNTDVEDLLREGMERFTRDLRAPAGLLDRAARLRRRQLAQRSVAGVAAALTAGAIALVTVVVPAVLENGSGAPIVDTAYVVKRVSSALSSAEPGEVAQMTVTRSAAIRGHRTVTTTAEEWSYGDQWRSVTNSPAGHPIYDEGLSAGSVYTVVSYLTRTWARERGLGRPNAPVFGPFGRSSPKPPVAGAYGNRVPFRSLPGPHRLLRLKASQLGPLGLIHPKPPVPSPRSCRPVVAAVPLLFQPGLPGLGFSASSLPAARALRNAISCGILAVAGRQRINGIEAIELTSRPKSLISETIWVTPGTYLPVRMIIRSTPGARVILRQTADITWLPLTAQNLAKLSVPIPAGFRRVREFPLAHALLPVLNQVLSSPLDIASVFCLGLAGPACEDRTSAYDLGPGHAGNP